MYGAVSFRPRSLKSISVHAAFIESQNEPNSQEACGVLTDFFVNSFFNPRNFFIYPFTKIHLRLNSRIDSINLR